MEKNFLIRLCGFLAGGAELAWAGGEPLSSAVTDGFWIACCPAPAGGCGAALAGAVSGWMAAFRFFPKGRILSIQLARRDVPPGEMGCVPSTYTSWFVASGLLAVTSRDLLSIGAAMTPRGWTNGCMFW